MHSIYQVFSLFKIGFRHLHLDSDMVTGLWYYHGPNFGSPFWFLRCKEHPCPWSPHMRLWRTLEVPDRGWHLDLDLNMVTGLWFTYFQNFWFEGAKNIHVLEVLIWGFGGCLRFRTGVWDLDIDFDMVKVFDTHMFWIFALYLDLEGEKNIHVL